MEFSTIAVEANGPRGRITLDRPDKLNPLGLATLEELAAAARWFDERPEVKVVVVSGRGRAFSAGADLAAFAGGDGAGAAQPQPVMAPTPAGGWPTPWRRWGR